MILSTFTCPKKRNDKKDKNNNEKKVIEENIRQNVTLKINKNDKNDSKINFLGILKTITKPKSSGLGLAFNKSNIEQNKTNVTYIHLYMYLYM